MGDFEVKARVEELAAEGFAPEAVYLELLGQGATVRQLEAAYRDLHAADTATEGRIRVVRIVSGTGALLVGAGVFSFVAANWSGMADWLKVAMIVSVMCVFSIAGWLVRDKTAYRFTGESLLTLGSLVFGAGIFLVAQIFNIRGNWPDGFVLWMIGSLAMAFAMRSTPLWVLAAVTGAIPAIGYPILLFEAGGPADPYALSPPLLLAAAGAIALASALTLRALLPRSLRERW